MEALDSLIKYFSKSDPAKGSAVTEEKDPAAITREEAIEQFGGSHWYTTSNGAQVYCYERLGPCPEEEECFPDLDAAKNSYSSFDKRGGVKEIRLPAAFRTPVILDDKPDIYVLKEQEDGGFLLNKEKISKRTVRSPSLNGLPEEGEYGVGNPYEGGFNVISFYYFSEGFFNFNHAGPLENLKTAKSYVSSGNYGDGPKIFLWPEAVDAYLEARELGFPAELATEHIDLESQQHSLAVPLIEKQRRLTEKFKRAGNSIKEIQQNVLPELAGMHNQM